MRPLLGFKAESIYDVQLPTLASYKLDGWRGIWQGLEFFSRSGKTIPNRALQAMARAVDLPPGYDGEIIVGAPNDRQVFRKTDSFCKTRKAAMPAEGVRFFVFDNCLDSGVFADRQRRLVERMPFVVVLDQYELRTYDELAEFEHKAVSLGYEGVVCRSLRGRYKHGRSTKREQYLVKVKRYTDEECCIIGTVELQHNANPAFTSELGYTKRSSHQDNKVPGGVLGALIVDWRGKPTRVGSGFDWKDRVELWKRRDDILGDWATIKFSPPTRDLPRQAVFKSIRSKHEL